MFLSLLQVKLQLIQSLFLGLQLPFFCLYLKVVLSGMKISLVLDDAVFKFRKRLQLFYLQLVGFTFFGHLPLMHFLQSICIFREKLFPSATLLFQLFFVLFDQTSLRFLLLFWFILQSFLCQIQLPFIWLFDLFHLILKLFLQLCCFFTNCYDFLFFNDPFLYFLISMHIVILCL